MAPPRLEPGEALIGPFYLVAALLVVTPAVDFALSVGSPQPGSVQWRFATVGLLSGYTLTPILGFTMALAVAGLAGHTLVQRVVVWLCLLTSIALLILLVGFALDMLQLRASIPAEGQPAFRSASARAVIKHALAAFGFGYLWFSARRMIPERTKEKQPRRVHIVAK
jgi:hypothetical protein